MSRKPQDWRAARAGAERRGRRAESLAALWLMARGWRIVARRRQLPMIEVDIVARRGAVLAVVEVKQRGTLDAAIAALTPDAARRLRQAAAQLAAEQAGRTRKALVARVDLIALAPGRWPRHIPDVH
jgi:putative endonuclease